jgi:hypothetical protein
VWQNGRLLEKVHPPDGEHEKWWRRLSTALGTVSSDFTNQCLFQIQAAAGSPFGGISELAINAALAMIEPQLRKMKLRERSPSRWHARTQPIWRFSRGWTADSQMSGAFQRSGRLRLD